MGHFLRRTVPALGLAVVWTAAADSAPEDAEVDYPWRPFAPVQRPVIPPVPDADWVRNPIDAFVAAKHGEHGLHPRPAARPAVLLRRVYLDLTGLPPSPEEIRAFEAAVGRPDGEQRAYGEIVERLLASPHYGERWGRHWMDIWRYADRDRKQVKDGSEIPAQMWRWRDWIVESLNADKPYAVMVKHMLAGDELAPDDPDTLVATGFLARNKAKSRDVWLHDTVDHTFQAFTGLTVQCARCHDHPVDDITQVEYYELRAIFEPHEIRIDPAPGSNDAKKNGIPRAYDVRSNTRTYLYIRGNELDPDRDTEIVPGVPSLLGGPSFSVEPVSLTVAKDEDRTSSGRRKALADWLCDPRHPLTARVAVNHIWARHFGRPIVSSVNDFGNNGQAPTHPALLDWLAAEFMAHGWSMKHLHRLIVTSNTYCLASTAPRDTETDRLRKRDPDNRFLWRFSPRRIEAEAVRDSLLAISGRLDRAVGGPVLDAERGAAALRRSLYFRHGPNTQMTFLRTFDGAVAQECYTRRHSVQPQQALALWNSRVAVESARCLARELSQGSPNDPARFVEAAFMHVLGRSATDEEQQVAAEFLETQTGRFESSEDARRGTTDKRSDFRRPASASVLRARESLVHLLFNHHEFVTLR